MCRQVQPFNFVRSHSEKTNSKLPALMSGRVNFLKNKKTNKKKSQIKQVIISFFLQKFTMPIHRHGSVTMMSPVQCKHLGCLHVVFSLEPQFSHI